MSRQRIAASEDSALLVPREILERIGVDDGDEIDVSVIDRTVILRPLDEASRAETVAEITKSLFERRHDAYEELAKGTD